VASEAIGCQTFDTLVPTPHRYMTLQSAQIYKGCGRYVVVRCLNSISAGQTLCRVIEIADAAQVDSE